MELVTMNKEELKRKGIMDQLEEKRIRQKVAAEVLGISVRQLKRLHEGLSLVVRLGIQPWVVGAVGNFAKIAHAEGQTERALALLGLARRQPAWSSDAQRDLDETLARWALDPVEVEAGMAKGAELDWEQTIAELLKE